MSTDREEPRFNSYDPDGGEDFSPPGSMPLVSPQTVAWINQNYGTNFAGPKEYLDWMYGGSGQVSGSTSPLNDYMQYYIPQNGNVNAPVNRGYDYNPANTTWENILTMAPLVIAGGGLLAGAGGAAGATQAAASAA